VPYPKYNQYRKSRKTHSTLYAAIVTTNFEVNRLAQRDSFFMLFLSAMTAGLLQASELRHTQSSKC
jgi:hypothetical protein